MSAALLGADWECKHLNWNPLTLFILGDVGWTVSAPWAWQRGWLHAFNPSKAMPFSLGIQPRTVPWNHRVKPVRVARPSCNDGLWNAIPVLPLSPQKPDTEQRGGGSGILGALWAPPFLRESACAMQRGSMLATYTTRVGCVAVSTRMTLHTQQVPLSAQHPKWSAFSWQCFQQCIVVACNFCRRQQCECLVALAAGAVAKSCDSCLKRAGWLWIWWIEKDRVMFKFLGFIFFKPYLLEGQ